MKTLGNVTPTPEQAKVIDDAAPGFWLIRGAAGSGKTTTALIRLKFGGLRTTAVAMAPWMVWALATSPPEGSGDRAPTVVTWVPLGSRRRRIRGYDQAELLARAVGAIMGCSPRRLLRRVVETAPQARRSGPERRRGLRGAFEATCDAPPRILLIDDVLTSGSTVASCALALRRAGADGPGTAAR